MKEKCKYCGSTINIQEEHIRPESKGGNKTVPACKACNQSKGPKALMEWFRWLKLNYPYRWKRIVTYNYKKKNEIAKKVHKIRDE